MRGESAYVVVSRDAVNPNFPDPDAGPIDQRSTVDVESGGRVEVDGANALLVVGDAGPAADGVFIVTGPGSTLSLAGAGNRILVGDDGGTGRLEVRDGGRAFYARLATGANGYSNLPEAGGSAADGNEATDEIIANLPRRRGGGPEASRKRETTRARKTRPERARSKLPMTPRSGRSSRRVRPEPRRGERARDERDSGPCCVH